LKAAIGLNALKIAFSADGGFLRLRALGVTVARGFYIS
jgi:hypothetical protein